MKKINSLQGLRAIAFIGIFLTHVGYRYEWAGFGVTTFFILSGFLLMYQYNNTDIPVSFKENIIFSLNKIKKLYLLHIITMSTHILFEIFIIKREINIEFLRDIVLNITLLQTWFPDSVVNVSLNGVAWFLSVMMFLYFMFPFIAKWIKNKSFSFLVVVCFILLVLKQVQDSVCFYYRGYDNLYCSFAYSFPVPRLIDFFVGCCVGKLYVNTCDKDISISKLKGTVFEILATIYIIITYFSFKNEFITKNLSLPMNVYDFFFITSCAIWVYLFAINSGYITKFLSNKFFVYIGNISAYAFLIHYQVLIYGNIYKRAVKMDETNFKILTVYAIIQFIITIALTNIYILLKKRIDNRKK